MRRLAAMAGSLLLAGCASVEPPSAAGAAPARAAAPTLPWSRSSARDLVDFAGRLKGMNDAALAAEAARLRKEPGDLARVKAALALSLSAQADEGEILGLVDPVIKRDGGDAEVKSMASFLHGLAVDRRRLKESAATAGTKLREERRALEAQKQRADALQERAAQLQQKLDALTDLEKSLSDRQAPTR